MDQIAKELLEAEEVAKEPHMYEVVVSGAGSTAANGTYLPEGLFYGKRRWVTGRYLVLY